MDAFNIALEYYSDSMIISWKECWRNSHYFVAAISRLPSLIPRFLG
jgi:hypothetical protein